MSIFSKIEIGKERYNRFNLSHDRKFSMKLGELTPILCIETMPGDKFDYKTSHMARLAPMAAPIMHEVNTYIHYFFVPNRILWDNWEEFITGGKDGQQNPPFPVINTYAEPGSLEDYLGMNNVLVSSPIKPQYEVSAIPFAAYQKIYQDFYKDENLSPEEDVILVNGNNDSQKTFLTQMRNRPWKKDYFTTALPFTQRGPEVELPISGTAPIIRTGASGKDVNWIVGGSSVAKNANGVNHVGIQDIQAQYPTSPGSPNGGLVAATSNTPVGIDNTNQLSVNENRFAADLSNAEATTINEIRRAIVLQQWLEKSARAGFRYVEQLLVHFGVQRQDARFQRAEFLGGYKLPIQISEVLQTSSTNSEPTPQANMAGHGINAGYSGKKSFYCPEHGYIIGIMSIMPKPSYMQGIPRHFLRRDRFDFPWPSFAHLGEQPIQNKELYAASDGKDEDVFGYTPRYAEMKYHPDTVHGTMKSTLDFWHLARKFANRPQLNTDFIFSMDDYDHVFAVADAEQVYVHVYNDIKVARKLPYFGTPGIPSI
jgi:hypothetical protein